MSLRGRIRVLSDELEVANETIDYLRNQERIYHRNLEVRYQLLNCMERACVCGAWSQAHPVQMLTEQHPALKEQWILKANAWERCARILQRRMKEAEKRLQPKRKPPGPSPYEPRKLPRLKWVKE